MATLYTRTLSLSLIALILSGCGVSNFLLGTDNTIAPVELMIQEESTSLTKGWDLQVGKGIEEQYARLTTAINSNIVYAMDINGSVHAIELSTGRTLWKIKLDALKQGITFGNGKLFLTDQKGYLIALSASNGDVLWKTRAAGSAASSPTVANSQNLVILRTLSGALQAFNADTGNIEWNYIISKPTFVLNGGAQPIIWDDNIVIPTDYGQIGVVKIQDGSVIWGQTLDINNDSVSSLSKLADIDAQPILDGDVLYVAKYNDKLSAIDLANKKILWTQPVGVFSGLALDSETLYSINKDSELFAWDRDTGKQIWHSLKLQGRKLTRPVLINQRMIVGDYAGYVHIIDKNSGNIIGSRKISDSEFLPDIQVSGQSIILQDIMGKVHRVDFTN